MGGVIMRRATEKNEVRKVFIVGGEEAGRKRLGWCLAEKHACYFPGEVQVAPPSTDFGICHLPKGLDCGVWWSDAAFPPSYKGTNLFLYVIDAREVMESISELRKLVSSKRFEKYESVPKVLLLTLKAGKDDIGEKELTGKEKELLENFSKEIGVNEYITISSKGMTRFQTLKEKMRESLMMSMEELPQEEKTGRCCIL